MEHYLAPWVGTGNEESGGPFRPPTDQAYSVLDWRGDCTVPDGWCLVAVAQRDNDLVRGRGVYLGDNLDDRAAGVLLMRTLGLNPKGDDRPDVRAAVLDLLLEHATSDDDRSRWNRLRPAGRRHEVWLGGQRIVDVPVVRGGAVYTESFNKANSGTLGPDLTWTEVFNDSEVVGNQMEMNTSSGVEARAEHDCATNNNYAQIATMDGSAAWGTTFSYRALARYASAARTCYQAVLHYTGGILTDKINKQVTGTTTELASAFHSGGLGGWSFGDIVRCEANGSTIRSLYNGTATHEITDTAIATGTRGGIALTATNANDVGADDFEMGDLATPSAAAPRARRNVVVTT